MTDTDLTLRAGVPYARRFRVVGAANVWPTLGDVEVRGQVRARRSHDAALVLDLAPYITPSIEGEDIVGDISMTGAETRTMVSGHYDIVLSDPGDVDARLVPVLQGEFKVLPQLLTAPA